MFIAQTSGHFLWNAYVLRLLSKFALVEMLRTAPVLTTCLRGRYLAKDTVETSVENNNLPPTQNPQLYKPLKTFLAFVNNIDEQETKSGIAHAEV